MLSGTSWPKSSKSSIGITVCALQLSAVYKITAIATKFLMSFCVFSLITVIGINLAVVLEGLKLYIAIVANTVELNTVDSYKVLDKMH